jgi:perosamine synthetase
VRHWPPAIEETADFVKAATGKCEDLNEQLSKFPAFELPGAPDGDSVHTYYVHGIKFNKEVAGIDRNTFVEALKAEIPSAVLRETAPLIGAGYVRPLYLQPIYQKKAAWAFSHPANQNGYEYPVGLCPVTEQMHFEKLFTNEYMRPGMAKADMQDVANACEKIFENVHELVAATVVADA